MRVVIDKAAYILYAAMWVLLPACSTGLFSPVSFLASSPPVILVSDNSPVFTHITGTIARKIESESKIYSLNGDSRMINPVIRKIAQDSDGTVIAVGHLATQAAHKLDGRRIVFCQVFNYEDPVLLSPLTRGVKATPPVIKQLQAWVALNPKLKRIVLVTGTGLRDFPLETKNAAKPLGLEIVHIEVASDKELLYAVKNINLPVQGILLAPDNRVLSTTIMRELISYSVRKGIGVAVFNSQLLELGALISAEVDDEEVASAVMTQLSFGDNRMLALLHANIRVNKIAAKQYGLSVPEKYQAGPHVF